MSKRKTINKKTRKLVFNKYNGHCAYCGCELTMKTMQVDHITSVDFCPHCGAKMDIRLKEKNNACSSNTS